MNIWQNGTKSFFGLARSKVSDLTNSISTRLNMKSLGTSISKFPSRFPATKFSIKSASGNLFSSNDNYRKFNKPESLSELLNKPLPAIPKEINQQPEIFPQFFSSSSKQPISAAPYKNNSALSSDSPAVSAPQLIPPQRSEIFSGQTMGVAGASSVKPRIAMRSPLSYQKTKETEANPRTLRKRGSSDDF